MNIVVFRQSIRQVRRTLALLAAGAGAFYYLVLFSSSSFVKGSGTVGFFRNPPRAIDAFVGGRADFLHPSGWLAAGMAHPVTMALLIGAGLSIAAGAVATEVERGTIDLALTRPVGRGPFLLAKACASAAAVTVVEAGGLVGVLVARLTIARMDEMGLPEVFRAFFGSWLLFVALAMVGVLVSARSSLRGRAVGVSVGVVVAWFFVNFIALLIDGVSGMRFVSPFHYFQASDFIPGIPLWNASALGALAVGAVSGALWAFAARDLTH